MDTEKFYGSAGHSWGYSPYCDWESLPDWAKVIADKLPHGSGIDYDWTFETLKNGKVRFYNSYHGMNEGGMYVGSIEFSLTFAKDVRDFRFMLHDASDGWERYWADYWDLRNYLPDTIYWSVYEF